MCNTVKNSILYYVTNIKVKDGSPWIWYFNEYAQSYVKIITCHFELNWRYDYILRGIFHFNICNIIQNWVLNDIAHQIVIHLKTSRCFHYHVFSRLTSSLLWRHIQICTEGNKCTRKGHARYFITLLRVTLGWCITNINRLPYVLTIVPITLCSIYI